MTATDEQSDEIAALRAALAALLAATEAAFDGTVTLQQLDDMAAGGNRLAAAMAQGRKAAQALGLTEPWRRAHSSSRRWMM